MTRTRRVLSVVILVGSGCRAGQGPLHSTGVGNPGNMTVSVGPTTDVDLQRVAWSLGSVALSACDGVIYTSQGDTGPVSLDGTHLIALPDVPDADICGLTLTGSAPLEGEGSGGPEDGAFSLELVVPPLVVNFEAPVRITADTTLAVELGRSGWLDAAWLGLTADATVVVDETHPQYRTITGKLTEVDVTVEGTEATIGQTDPTDTAPSVHVAVGLDGWMVASANDGHTWTELRAAVDGDADDHLYGVAATSSGAEEPLLVAVGGETEGRVVVADASGELDELVVPTFGLRDVVHTGDRFVAVGLEGRVAKSTDGTGWFVLDPLGDCNFRGVAARGEVLVAVGVDTGVGCAWRSDDGGESYTELPSLPSAGNRAVVTADTIVVVGEDGKISHMDSGASAWTTLYVEDPFLHDVLVRDGWVKVLGDAGVYYSDDLESYVGGETAGFIRWVPSLDDQDLLALTEDGDVYRSPGDDARALDDWAFHGSLGRSALGGPFTAVTAWRR